ncbi:MAG: DUF2254 domain-containing protein [Kofleriaceae bacterium]|nr:DUF2254 domain-containing protein [Kofleriaceae bacterium]
MATNTTFQAWRRNPLLRLRAVRQQIRSSLWFAPAVGALLALVAAYLLAWLDHRARGHQAWMFDGGPESARALLSTIASSMLTFTALVFSITILALQLASNQFSPRVIRTFLEDRITKIAIAVFVGTFVYAVAVLSKVRSFPERFVPAIATWTGLLLVLVSIGVFIQYVHRMAHSIRVITIITKVAAETRRGIEHELERAARHVGRGSETGVPVGAPDAVLHHRGDPGVLTFVDTRRLVELATRAGSRFELLPRIGDFVPTGYEVLHIWGKHGNEANCSAALGFDIERTPDQDPAFGFRQLVDIALRAVSPGINDPSTAVQALDHIHDLLRRLAVRDLRRPPYCDADGIVRLTVRHRSYSDFVHLAFDELRDYGATSEQVTHRIRLALHDCLSVATEDNRAVLREQLELLERRAAQVRH